VSSLPSSIVERLAELERRYPQRQALLLPALRMAQEHWGGWLPDAAIAAVAEHLELAPAKVYGVVSFYDLFHQHPVGRHRLRICDNLPCLLRGAGEIVAAVADELGVGAEQVTPDGRCSWVHFECLGSCDTAPVMMVDDEYHENLTPDRARALVRGLE
jgi:NADH-quinone oxidoreductase subunit E